MEKTFANKKEYIYLVPGNWFELKNINTDRCQPYDIDMLKQEILEQVNNRAEKLNFVNTQFYPDCQNAAVESIDFYLDNCKFNRIAQYIEKDRRHPIISFHGTKPDAIDSIIKNGYIIAGDKTAAIKINMAHGAVYGHGVYTSSFFGKANCYAKPDTNGYVYIIINIQFPGKAVLIPPLFNTIRDIPANGFYKDGINTRIVYGLDQIIAADPDRIIPVAVMKIKTNHK